MVNFGTLAVGSDDGNLARPLPRICPHSRTDLPVISQFFLGLTSEVSQSFNKMFGCDSERTEKNLNVTWHSFGSLPAKLAHHLDVYFINLTGRRRKGKAIRLTSKLHSYPLHEQLICNKTLLSNINIPNSLQHKLYERCWPRRAFNDSNTVWFILLDSP